MLRSSFLHIRGIGPRRQRYLHRTGLCDWRQAACADPLRLPESMRHVPEAARVSLERLAAGDALFFCARLEPRERWRVLGEFFEEAAFLDVETDWHGWLTVVGVYYRGEYRAFVRGRNMDAAAAFMRRLRLVVTYNGAGFDVPVLCRQLFGCRWRLRGEEDALFKRPRGVHLPATSRPRGREPARGEVAL